MTGHKYCSAGNKRIDRVLVDEYRAKLDTAFYTLRVSIVCSKKLVEMSGFGPKKKKGLLKTTTPILVIDVIYEFHGSQQW